MEKQYVTYECVDGVATLTMNDGGQNLVAPAMIGAIHKALDRAEKDKAVVILTGQSGIFSAGFDLKVLRTGVQNAFAMLNGGFALTHRLLSFPYPVIIACSGHAIAMGSFLLMAGDHRIGVEGAYKIMANEVALGLNMPFAAIVLCQQRLTAAELNNALLLSHQYDPAGAVAAGFLDRVVAPDELLPVARKLAQDLTRLDMRAHHVSKLRMRKTMLAELKRALARDKVAYLQLGLERLVASKAAPKTTPKKKSKAA